MKISLPTGKYVIAVSGGVDSVVLLHMLANNQETHYELVVAHFDHGIRADSGEDKNFVERLAQKYDLPFEYQEGKLGPGASEEVARKARYDFLHRVRVQTKAQAIVTAHHQNDLIETMFINMIRGTRYKGLISLSNSDEIVRPLLGFSKQEVIDYAKKNNLIWHEDSTNTDTKYLRNWIRKNLIDKLSDSQKNELLRIHANTKQTNQELESLLDDMGADKEFINKRLLSELSHEVAKEYIAHWLRANKIKDFDNKMIDRIVVGSKTLRIGKTIDVIKGHKISIEKENLTIVKASIS